MAFTPIGSATALGSLLQISYSEGVRQQLSADYREWEQIKMIRDGDPMGKQTNFSFQTGRGPGRVQYKNPSSNSAFPRAQRIRVSEQTALYKEFESTIEIDYNLYKQLLNSPNERYAELLALEIESGTIDTKRRMASDFYGDGTGVVCQNSAAASDAALAASGQVTVTIDDSSASYGHFGNLEYQDLLLAKSTVGAAVSPSGGAPTGTFYAWRVLSKNRRAGTAVLEAVTNADIVITGFTASNIVATNVFYRVGQETIPNLTTVTNYSEASEVWAGLESLAANDGRSVHGITMSGLTAGTVLDCSGNPIDSSYLQAGMDDVKINVGKGAYAWKKMAMAPEAHASFVESRETDRRFVTKDDAVRGIKVFGFQHEEDFLESYSSEFVKKQRIWVLPEAKAGNKVLEWHGTDFEPVSAKGSDPFMLKPASGGGHEPRMVSYMHGSGVMICKHPASILQIKNFTI